MIAQRLLASVILNTVDIRSAPSSPTVSAAVRALPLRSFQRAKRWPLRTKVSAPDGNGLVYVFLTTLP